MLWLLQICNRCLILLDLLNRESQYWFYISINFYGDSQRSMKGDGVKIPKPNIFYQEIVQFVVQKRDP